jgi:hypothetical protein
VRKREMRRISRGRKVKRYKNVSPLKNKIILLGCRFYAK